MRSLNFRHPKGRVLAQGFFFDLLIPENTLKQRVLDLWENNSKFYKFEFGYVLLQKKPTPEFVESCLGAPLIGQENILSNVLLDTTSESATVPEAVSVCLAVNGELKLIELTNDTLCDPSLWLDLDHYNEVITDTLGEIRKPDVVADKKDVSVREALGDPQLKESTDLKKTLDRLGEISRSEASEPNTSGVGLSNLFSRLKRAFSSNRSNGAGNGQGRPNYNPVGEQSGSGGIFKKIANAFTHYLMTSALAKAIGKAHAKHVQNMMDQFSDGNFEDALRNAIPLSNMQDALEAKNYSLRLGGQSLPQSIRPYSQSGGSSVLLEDNLLYQMRQMYEQAFRALDQQGNYKKAAFVLAELLRETDRAVQYLEKHKEYKLAAELAEGQKLTPSRIVRQWVLAKDVKRAMEVAVIAACYQEAITLLQSSHPKEADDLRWHCANLHFRAGDIKAAVDIAWPIKEKRVEAIEWMKQSFRLGGEVGIQHLLRLALFDPDNYASYITHIDQQFQSESFREGLALIDEIISYGNEKPNKRIASIAARYYLSTVAQGSLKFDRKRWNQLCMIAGDLTLRADVRGLDLNQFEGISKEKETLTNLTFSSTHGRQAEDCVLLVGGKKLIAFGESGVELWSSKGELLSRFSIPCHRIVVSDSSNTALLIANRSGYQIVNQFDLKSRSVNYWLDLDIHQWASSFDGHSWIVSNNDTVFVLDVLASEQSTLWSVKELPGLVTNIVRTENSFSVCLSAEEQFQIWVYELPNLYLQERSPHSTEQLENFLPAAVNEKGIIVGIYPEQGNAFGLFEKTGSVDWITLGVENDIQTIDYIGELIFVTSADDEMAYADVFPVQNRKIQASSLSLNFEGAKNLTTRSDGTNAVIHSNDGRVVTVNLADRYVDSDFVLN